MICTANYKQTVKPSQTKIRSTRRQTEDGSLPRSCQPYVFLHFFYGTTSRKRDKEVAKSFKVEQSSLYEIQTTRVENTRLSQTGSYDFEVARPGGYCTMSTSSHAEPPRTNCVRVVDRTQHLPNTNQVRSILNRNVCFKMSVCTDR